MNLGRTVFAQILDFLPLYEFRKCVNRYGGNYKIRRFSCLDQFLCMAFAQLSYRESLRDIETCLRSLKSRLYHIGIRAKVSRSTLADANERRDWRIWADLAQVLIGTSRSLYANEEFGLSLSETVYAFDSTTIDLCLALFPWARFRKHKAAIKAHTLLDLRGSIPCFVRITEGRTHDINILDELILEPGTFYIMDRGYIDFLRLYRFTQSMAYFVIRSKNNLDYARRTYRQVDKVTGLRSDQTIRLRGPLTSQDYPEPLRRVRFFDAESQRSFVFLSNNFLLPPLVIAQLYKCRWKVELFFKWIKQYLRIKTFYGTSENAVKTQIWIALCVYLLIAIMKKELRIQRTMGEISQILSISLFEKTPIYQTLMHFDQQSEKNESNKQFILFNL
jgi:hypothetical protein